MCSRPGRFGLGAQFLVEDAQLRLHGERGIAGARRMALDGERGVPERHDRVAHVLVDRAAIAQHQVGHRRQEAVHEPRQAVRIELLGDAREAAHVGEHHGDLALLAAELQQLGMAGDLLDHVGRQVEAEGAADRRALALGAHEGERRAADVDRRQGHRRIDRIEQQVVFREGEPRDDEPDADEDRRDDRHAAGRQARQQQHEQDADQPEIEELRAVGEIRPGEEVLRRASARRAGRGPRRRARHRRPACCACPSGRSRWCR